MENKYVTRDSASLVTNLDDTGDVILEDADCPLGCPRKDHPVLKGKDRLHGLPGEYSVVKCCACGLLRTNPRPTPASMSMYYPDNYGPYLSTQVPPKNSDPSPFVKRYLVPIARRVLDTKALLLPPLPPGRMLEVGCASGAFLHSMAEKGWGVEGIEFSDSASSEARKLGYNVHSGALETAPVSTTKFDLVVAWMVLEHLHDPVKGLQKLADQSKSGAWLALSVPDAAAFECQFFGDYWYALQLPTHLYHFTPETLAKVLDAGGWAIDSVHHQRTIANFLMSCTYYFDDINLPRVAGIFRKAAQASPFWRLLQFPFAWIMSLLGQTGRMTVWARRKA